MKWRLSVVKFLASFMSSSFLGHVYHTAKRSCNHHHHALHESDVKEHKQRIHGTTHTTYAPRPTSQSDGRHGLSVVRCDRLLVALSDARVESSRGSPTNTP